jgi:hypothetical protein
VGFFISKFDEMFDKNGGDGDLFLDFGLHGREEFLLFAVAVGFFVAFFSMILAILGLHDNPHWAAVVCILST